MIDVYLPHLTALPNNSPNPYVTLNAHTLTQIEMVVPRVTYPAAIPSALRSVTSQPPQYMAM